MNQSADTREKLRYSYKPRRIRLLFIAESPPSSGGFFYNSRTIGRDYLFAETMRALELWPKQKPMRKNLDKRRLLKQFRSMGFFLIDSSLTPVDKLKNGERTRRLRGCIPRVLDEVTKLKPRKIVLVKKSVFKILRPELERRHLTPKLLNKQFLPFPSHGNQPEYRRRLGTQLNKL